MCALLILLACTGEAPEPEPSAPPEPVMYVDRSEGAFGAGGCRPHGAVRSLRGRFVVDPPRPDEHFGKYLQGEWLVEEGGRRWLLSYAPRPDYARFADQDVIVRGWECTKVGQAIMAPHFDTERIAIEATLPEGMLPE